MSSGIYYSNKLGEKLNPVPLPQYGLKGVMDGLKIVFKRKSNKHTSLYAKV